MLLLFFCCTAAKEAVGADVDGVVRTPGVKPTLSELEKFEEQPEGMDVELARSAKAEQEHLFTPGDNVEVIEGELINLQGSIVKIDGNKVTIMPKHEDLKVSYKRGATDCC